MIKISSEEKVYDFCLKCGEKVEGKEGYFAFSIYGEGTNYIFKCECGYQWEEED